MTPLLGSRGVPGMLQLACMSAERGWSMHGYLGTRTIKRRTALSVVAAAVVCMSCSAKPEGYDWKDYQPPDWRKYQAKNVPSYSSLPARSYSGATPDRFTFA